MRLNFGRMAQDLSPSLALNTSAPSRPSPQRASNITMGEKKRSHQPEVVQYERHDGQRKTHFLQPVFQKSDIVFLHKARLTNQSAKKSCQQAAGCWRMDDTFRVVPLPQERFLSLVCYDFSGMTPLRWTRVRSGILSIMEAA